MRSERFELSIYGGWKLSDSWGFINMQSHALPGSCVLFVDACGVLDVGVVIKKLGPGGRGVARGAESGIFIN